MTAEIVSFAERRREQRLLVVGMSIDELTSEIERLLVGPQPLNDVAQVLKLIETFGDRLMELATLLPGFEPSRNLQTAFDRLEDRIARAKLALHELDGEASR